jgi:hypothetical protein
MEYRRKERTQIWHFRRDCPNWPKAFNFVVLHDRQNDSQICGECIRLAATPTAKALSLLPSIIEPTAPLLARR